MECNSHTASECTYCILWIAECTKWVTGGSCFIAESQRIKHMVLFAIVFQFLCLNSEVPFASSVTVSVGFRTASSLQQDWTDAYFTRWRFTSGGDICSDPYIGRFTSCVSLFVVSIAFLYRPIRIVLISVVVSKIRQTHVSPFGDSPWPEIVAATPT